MGRVFNFRSGRMHTIHLRPSVAAIQPNLELKTWPKQLLGSLRLVIALPGTPSSLAREREREKEKERERERERDSIYF